MNPMVCGSANKERKLEFEYIGIAICRAYMKLMTTSVYITWLFGFGCNCIISSIIAGRVNKEVGM